MFLVSGICKIIFLYNQNSNLHDYIIVVSKSLLYETTMVIMDDSSRHLFNDIGSRGRREKRGIGRRKGSVGNGEIGI